MDTRGAIPDPGVVAQAEPGRLYRLAIEPVEDVASIRARPETFLRQFATLNEAQRLLFAAECCVSEVAQGGFNHFFHDPEGILAPEAAEGLTLIGLPVVAGIVRAAAAQLGAPFLRDRAKRITLLEKMTRPGRTRAEWDAFFTLDTRFYAVYAPDDFSRHADAYVREHMDAFFR